MLIIHTFNFSPTHTSKEYTISKLALFLHFFLWDAVSFLGVREYSVYYMWGITVVKCLPGMQKALGLRPRRGEGRGREGEGRGRRRQQQTWDFSGDLFALRPSSLVQVDFARLPVQLVFKEDEASF